MVKTNSKFVCQQCGYEQVGWAGRCPNCGEWNSLVETVQQTSKNIERKIRGGISSKSIKLTDITSKSTTRIITKIPELDRVLGGGLVGGQVVLVAGEPGIGKSTLLLQLADQLSGHRLQTTTKKAVDSGPSAVLYVSGEESASQIKVRADRLGIRSKNIELLEETNIDNIINTASQLPAISGRSSVSDKKPKAESQKLTALVVDSIQTMHTEDLSGMSGSVGQVRECTYRLVNFAKSTGTITFIVGHVTKEGTVAGPSVLAHLVDTVLWFEGEQNSTLRILRSFKNRFGPTDEVGIFSMEERGLVSESDPQKLFLSDGKHFASGSVTSSILQGTRPILIEVQSLVVPTKMAFPKRNAQGIDPRRFEMLVAVLTRRCGLPLYDWDVLVNVAGGLKAFDPGVDLAVCLSIASSFYDKTLPKKLLAIGEVGLLGEIRPVPMEEKRIKEARRIGFRDIASSNNYKFLSQAIKTYLK